MKYYIPTAICFVIFASTVFPQRLASIRSVDFKNFTYPGSRDNFIAEEYDTPRFKLKGGEWRSRAVGMIFQRVIYGDVTGDGKDEAMVVLYANNHGGSAVVMHVYIYRLWKGYTKFLWGFEGGDRAWGGLRKVYGKAGGLVVELWGKDTRIGEYLGSTEATGLCCPLSFTRSYYQWSKGTFRQVGESEILPNPMANKQCPSCLPESEEKEWH